MYEIKSWDNFFKVLSKTLYFTNIKALIGKQHERAVYPPKDLVFNAFNLTPLAEVKVVIIGQDPYHQPGQAMGLAFSVPSGVKLPPSLRNIYKEMKNDLGGPLMIDGDLTYLAKQGVLLLNTILTVEAGKPLSHQSDDYKAFTIDVLKCLVRQNRPMVFILWGNYARSFKKYIVAPNILIIEGSHPSPLGANKGGFFNTKPFSRTNTFLIIHNREPIKWTK